VPVTGFEHITHDLNEYELNVLLPVFKKGLSSKIGKGKAVTNYHMTKVLTEKGYKVSGARVRKIINHIRVHGLVPGLIATSAGYYISNDPEEIRQYCKSLSQRANELLRVKKSFEDHIQNLMELFKEKQ
jgi:hypothetical protein